MQVRCFPYEYYFSIQIESIFSSTLGDIIMANIEMRGTENWYPVTAQELKAKSWALKMGATVISRGAFAAWKCIDIVLFGQKHYIDYADKIILYGFSKTAKDWIPIQEL